MLHRGVALLRGAALLRPVALAGALALGITWQALLMTPPVAISPEVFAAAFSAEADPHPLPGSPSLLGELDGATAENSDDAARAGPCGIDATGERSCTGVEERVRAGTDVAGLTAGTLAVVTSGFWVLRRRREHRDLHPSGSRGTGERGLREQGLREQGLREQGLRERGLRERGLRERGLGERGRGERGGAGDLSR